MHAEISGWTTFRGVGHADDRGTVSFQGPGVTVDLTMRADGEIVGFEVQTTEGGEHLGVGPAQTITAQLLRRIPFGRLADVARATPLRTIRWPDEASEDRRLTTYVRSPRAQTPRPGRRGRPDRYYAEIAAAYEQWLGTGEPLRVLAERLVMPLNTLRSELGIARQRGLLTEAPRGRKGGQATDKAKQLLEQGADDDGER